MIDFLKNIPVEKSRSVFSNKISHRPKALPGRFGIRTDRAVLQGGKELHDDQVTGLAAVLHQLPPVRKMRAGESSEALEALHRSERRWHRTCSPPPPCQRKHTRHADQGPTNQPRSAAPSSPLPAPPPPPLPPPLTSTQPSIICRPTNQVESFEDLNDGRALLDIVSCVVGEAVLDAAAATTGAQRVRAVLLFLASKYGVSLPKSNNKTASAPS